MREVVFAGGRRALAFGDQKINLHQYHAEFEPKALCPTPGSADLCLLTDTLSEEILRHLKACSVPVVEGPVERSGATGPLISIYVRDPDGNLIEIARPNRRARPVNQKELTLNSRFATLSRRGFLTSLTGGIAGIAADAVSLGAEERVSQAQQPVSCLEAPANFHVQDSGKTRDPGRRLSAPATGRCPVILWITAEPDPSRSHGRQP